VAKASEATVAMTQSFGPGIKLNLANVVTDFDGKFEVFSAVFCLGREAELVGAADARKRTRA
jgi:hypothetical protein